VPRCFLPLLPGLHCCSFQTNTYYAGDPPCLLAVAPRLSLHQRMLHPELRQSRVLAPLLPRLSLECRQLGLERLLLGLLLGESGLPSLPY
jgi:hypothetical protein